MKTIAFYLFVSVCAFGLLAACDDGGAADCPNKPVCEGTTVMLAYYCDGKSLPPTDLSPLIYCGDDPATGYCEVTDGGLNAQCVASPSDGDVDGDVDGDTVEDEATESDGGDGDATDGDAGEDDIAIDGDR